MLKLEFCPHGYITTFECQAGDFELFPNHYILNFKIYK